MTKTQIISFIIASLTLVGVLVNVTLFNGTIDPETGMPESITVDGQTIDFTWTDDDTGEDIKLYTDKSTYTNGVSSAEIYVAVQNAGTSQMVTLNGLFGKSSESIEQAYVLAEVTQDITHSSSSCEIVEGKGKNSTTTEECTTNETVERVIDNQWAELPLEVRDTAEEDVNLQKGTKTKKNSDGYTSDESLKYEMDAGEIIYLKLLVAYEANTSGNFFLEAVGSNGSYGHLDPWFDSNWTYKIPIEINPSYVDGSSSHTNFPVYLDLADLPSGFHTNVKTDGCDIRIVESDDSTETAFELVDYDSTGDTGELHFLADSLSYTATTTFYIYYGNSGASCYAITATYGAENVWIDYEAIYHMEEDPSGTAPQMLDSTANNHDLTTAGSMTSGDSVAGKMGNAVDFDGTNDWMSAPDAANLDPGLGDFSVSSYVNLDDATTRQQVVFKGDTSGDWWFHGMLSNTSLEHGYDDGSQFQFFRPTVSAINTSQWYHWFGSRDKGTSIDMSEDGVDLGSNSTNNGDVSSALDLEIGTTNGEIGSVYIDGRIDEIRIRQSVLSADWVSTEYNNQDTPEPFYWVGAQETDGGGGGGGDDGKGYTVIFN